jgi:hypothetical protein
MLVIWVTIDNEFLIWVLVIWVTIDNEFLKW